MKDCHKTLLKNGMTVVFKEVRSAPVVALQLWVKVGSADEEEKAGICHVIEHMLFKGTKKRGPGGIAYDIESLGGEINAFTSFDQTVYYVLIASRFFGQGLNVLADAILNPSFDPAELEKEKEVVLEEIKRGKDQPMAKLAQTLFATSYKTHNYRHPIIGFPNTVKAIEAKDLLMFHKKWYIPRNMSLILVGNINKKTALAEIEETFKGFNSKKIKNQKRIQEPPQNALRNVIMTENVMEGYMGLAFHTPHITHQDSCALDILSFVLGHGESSRLFKKVKDEKELTHTIGCSNFLPAEPGLLIIQSTLHKRNSKEALAAILKETFRLRYEKIDGEELDKAKLNIENEFVYCRETVQGQARQLGHFQVVAGNIDYEDEYINQVLSTKSQDIMEVAKKYLRTKNMTVIFLLPHGGAEIIGEDTIKEVASLEEQKAKDSVSKSLKKRKKEVKKTVLENGMTVLIQEEPSTSIVAMRAVFLGGVRFEEERVNGINNFIAEMLTKGTKNLSAREIAQRTESMAAFINGFSGKNSFGLCSEMLSRFFDRGLELFADILMHPRFGEDELEKKRSDLLAELNQQEDHLASYTFKIFAKTLYEKHPYGMSVFGTKESILNMTKDDLKKYYREYTSPENFILSIVGDVEEEKTLSKVSQAFQHLERKSFSTPHVPMEPSPEFIRNIEVYKEKQQAHLVIGFLGTTIYSPDRYPMEVLNTVLSGQSGRLFVKLRDQLSLAYAVTSFSSEGIDPGSIGVYIGTSPEKLDVAVDAIKAELKQLRDRKIDPSELERAKRYLIGSFEIGLQTNSAKAATIAFGEGYGLGHSHFMEYPKKISKVTREDVLSVTRKYIHLDRYSLAVVRPPKG